MFGNERWTPAALAGGLIVLALAGCGEERSVASKSAAAFREAQKRGETFGGEHAHGHGVAGGGEHVPAESAQNAGEKEDAAAGHVHGAGEKPAAGGPQRHADEHGGHAAMEHGRHPAAPAERHDHSAMEHAAPGAHAGHGAMARETPPAAVPPVSDHAGHAPTPTGVQSVPSAPPPVAVSPGQPSATLRPDPLDAPAATSVIDAQRAAQEMAGGGHGAHGAGTYRQVDAGRSAPAVEKDEHDEHQHEPPAERRQG
jgi:hypothetical protein